MSIIIYDKDCNEIKLAHAVDARELIKTGEYFQTKEAAKKAVKLKMAIEKIEKEEPVIEEPVIEEPVVEEPVVEEPVVEEPVVEEPVVEEIKQKKRGKRKKEV